MLQLWTVALVLAQHLQQLQITVATAHVDVRLRNVPCMYYNVTQITTRLLMVLFGRQQQIKINRGASVNVCIVLYVRE